MDTKTRRRLAHLRNESVEDTGVAPRPLGTPQRPPCEPDADRSGNLGWQPGGWW